MRKVLIAGATSSIGRAVADELARQGDRLFLAGRDADQLERTASDLRERHGASVECGRFEASELDGHPALVEDAKSRMGGLDGVVFAVGYLGEQPRESRDRVGALKVMEVNLTTAVSLLAELANFLEVQEEGFILALSSVAADRGRRSNYAYGAAKAGLSLFLDGLRHRLDSKGVKVFNVKLGFVDTRMTYGKPGMIGVASPEQIARGVSRVLGRPAGTYYLPSFWRWIMLAVRWIPEPIFKRLDL